MNICADENIIENELSSVNLQMMSLDYMVDHLNSETPYKLYLRKDDHSFGTDLFKKHTHFIKKVEHNSDFGLIFKKTVIHKFFKYGASNTDFNLKNLKNEENFGQIIFNLSDKSDVYQRSYIKLQSVFANVGGIANVVFILSAILAKIAVENLYIITIVNECFFKNESESPEKSKKNYKTTSLTNLNLENVEILNKIVKIAKNSEKNETLKKNINIKGKERSYLCCPLKNQKISLISDLHDKIVKMTSVEYLVNKINELEKLKYIVLDADNMSVFNSLPFFSNDDFNNSNNNNHQNLSNTMNEHNVISLSSVYR
jgi:hypothetical protein